MASFNSFKLGVCECTHGTSGIPRRRNYMMTIQETLGAMAGLKTAIKRMVVT
jgi:hypothetical protein